MRGDELFSHAAVVDLTGDASWAGVTAAVLCRYHRSMPSARRFPPPWSVEETAQAEVAVQQRQQELAQERIKAEIAVTQATGRATRSALRRRRKQTPPRSAATPRPAPSYQR